MCDGGGLGREVRGQIVEHRLALGRLDDGAPADHLVDRASPPGPRQPLLRDQIGLVTAHAARRHRVAPRARPAVLRGAVGVCEIASESHERTHLSTAPAHLPHLPHLVHAFTSTRTESGAFQR